MVTPQLLDYIRQRLSQGASREEITGALSGIGWHIPDIEEGFSAISQEIKHSGNQFFRQQVAAPSRLTKSFVILVSLGIIFLFGAAAFAYFYYIQPVSPEMVLSRMVQNVEGVKSITYKGEIRVQVDINDLSLPMLGGMAGLFNLSHAIPESQRETPLLITFEGASDARNPDKPKGFFKLDVSLIAPPEEKFSMAMEARLIEKMLYFKVSKLALGDGGAFLNKWVSINIEEFTKRLEQETGESLKATQFSKEETAKVRQEFIKARVIELTNTLPDEVLDGVSTHHYVFTFNKERFTQFLLEIHDVLAKQGISKDEIRDAQGILGVIDIFEGELWVGADDFLPYRVAFNLQIKDINKSDQVAALLTKIDFREFNTPVSLAVPEKSTPLEEFIGQYTKGSAGLP